MIHIVLAALVPVFFVLLLGYSAGRLHIVDNTHVGSLNTVVMSYALPASLLLATASTPREEMIGQWPILAILGGAMMLIYPLWYLFQRRVLHQSQSESALEALTIALPNYAAVGLPVVSALLGPGHAVPVAVAIAAGSLLPSPLTLTLLELSASGDDSGKGGAFTRFVRAMSHAVTKPIVVAPVMGTALSLLAVPLPPLAEAALQLIGQATGGMALFVTGLVLSAQRFRLSWSIALGAATTNIALPLLAFAIASVISFAWPIPETTVKVAVLMAALPSGFFGILFGETYGVKSEAAASALIASTLFSAITLAVAIAWFHGWPGA